MWAAELQAWGLVGPVLSATVRRRPGWAGGRGQSRPGWTQVLEPSYRQSVGPEAPGAPFRGSGYRRWLGPSAALQAGVPVGRCGPGRSRPAGPVPVATRARPRGHPCYCPAPRRGDPSAAAAPRRPGPPAWRSPGGGRGGPGAAALAGASQLPLPPGAPQGQLRGHGRRRLCAVGLAPALAGGGNCSPSPPAPKLAFPLPRRGLGAELVEAGWGECQGCPGIAHPREHLGSFWEEGLERSMVSVLVPEFCL